MITTTDLTKTYGSFNALNRVSISVNRGEIYGLLGLNGAGKTTLMRCLLNLIRCSGGEIRIDDRLPGLNLWKDVGYLVESPAAYPELTVRQNLELICTLRGIKKSAADSVIEQLKLTQYSRVRFKHLSLGNKQRVGLAKALIHKPAILILDEPVNGLDPEGIYEIRTLLSNLSRTCGTTILISSHLLDEIARIADRIGILHAGKMICELNRDELERVQDQKLVVDSSDNIRALEHLSDFEPVLSADGKLIIQHTLARKEPGIIATILVRNNLPPTSMNIVREDLEAYFLKIIHQSNPQT